MAYHADSYTQARHLVVPARGFVDHVERAVVVSIFDPLYGLAVVVAGVVVASVSAV